MCSQRSSGKSSSQNSRGPRPAPSARFCRSAPRSSTRRILPEIVFGNSANSSRRTRLNGARCARRWRKIDSAVSRSGRCPAPARQMPSAPPGAPGRGRGPRPPRQPRVLDQRAFQLERADPVVGGFEHVVGPADIGEMPVGVAHRDVAGTIHRAGQRHDRAVVALIALHQPERRRVEREAHFRLVLLAPVLVKQKHPIAGRRMAHRAGLDRLPRKIADLQCRLGLAVALADRQPPGGADLFDNFRVARLAGAPAPRATRPCAARYPPGSACATPSAGRRTS